VVGFFRSVSDNIFQMTWLQRRVHFICA